MTDNKPSFKIGIRLEQRFDRFQSVHLSLSQYQPPKKKNLTSKSHTNSARKTVIEHLANLINEGRLSNPKQPLMVISVRNVLSNLRCIAHIKGMTHAPISVAEEYPVLMEAQAGGHAHYRPYHVLGEINGKIAINEWDPRKPIDYSWFISGVPVLWDDEKPDKIYQRIVAEAADHSHVWHLPRDNHPETKEDYKVHWQNLQEIFIKTLPNSQEETFHALSNYVNKYNLKREFSYFHNILGIDPDGNLHQLANIGQLEELGKQIQSRGVRRALCVDNSGSVTAEFYPKGYAGALEGHRISLIAAPNHRLKGTSYIVIELENPVFKFY